MATVRWRGSIGDARKTGADLLKMGEEVGGRLFLRAGWAGEPDWGLRLGQGPQRERAGWGGYQCCAYLAGTLVRSVLARVGVCLGPVSARVCWRSPRWGGGLGELLAQRSALPAVRVSQGQCVGPF